MESSPILKMFGHASTVSLTHARICVVPNSRSEDLAAQTAAKPCPKDFADSKEWSVCQQKFNAILCLRPADKKGLPIPLMHAAFCEFTRHFYQPRLDEHTAEYLLMADNLCEAMPSAFSTEGARRDAFETIFRSLDKDLTQHTEYPLSASVSVSRVKETGGRPDVAKTISYDGGNLVLLLEEFNLGDGDVYMQICRAYEVLCGGAKVEHLVKFGNPIFLLCVLGVHQMFIPNNTF